MFQECREAMKLQKLYLEHLDVGSYKKTNLFCFLSLATTVVIFLLKQNSNYLVYSR